MKTHTTIFHSIIIQCCNFFTLASKYFLKIWQNIKNKQELGTFIYRLWVRSWANDPPTFRRIRVLWAPCAMNDPNHWNATKPVTWIRFFASAISACLHCTCSVTRVLNIVYRKIDNLSASNIAVFNFFIYNNCNFKLYFLIF